MKNLDTLTDVDTDQAENGVQTMVKVDRDSAARLGLTSAAIDAAMYDAFGQRQVANIYDELNQYHVVMEWRPGDALSPNALRDVQVAAKTPVGSRAPGAPATNASVPARQVQRE